MACPKIFTGRWEGGLNSMSGDEHDGDDAFLWEMACEKETDLVLITPWSCYCFSDFV